jgi:SAM-dependent methyltransferase
VPPPAGSGTCSLSSARGHDARHEVIADMPQTHSVATFLRSVYHRLPSPPSTNYYLGRTNIDPYSLVTAGDTVLDVGSGPGRGQYAFTHRGPEGYQLNYIALDVEVGEGVGCVADAHHLPFRSCSVDALMCVSTLEYLNDPFKAVQEFHRVLKPGGILYLSAPFVFPYHAPPEDFFRFSKAGIRALATGFEEIRSGTNRGPASTFCHVLVHFLAAAGSFNRRALHGVLLDAFHWLFFWIKYMDRWIGRFDTGEALYGSAFFLGRKAGDRVRRAGPAHV